MIEVSEIHTGSRVTYQPKFGMPEQGVVKTIRGESVWVVYHCDNNWNMFQHYTGALTDTADLYLGWEKP